MVSSILMVSRIPNTDHLQTAIFRWDFNRYYDSGQRWTKSNGNERIFHCWQWSGTLLSPKVMEWSRSIRCIFSAVRRGLSFCREYSQYILSPVDRFATTVVVVAAAAVQPANSSLQNRFVELCATPFRNFITYFLSSMFNLFVYFFCLLKTQLKSIFFVAFRSANISRIIKTNLFGSPFLKTFSPLLFFLFFFFF